MTAMTAASLCPLDPLSAAEVQRACDLLKAQQKLPASIRFVSVELHEPEKAEVLKWKPGVAAHRAAFAVLFDSATGDSFEALVDLTAGKVTSWVKLALDQAPYGQASVIVDEFKKAEVIVKADRAWREAVKRRGLTDKDIENAQIDPVSAGYFGYENEKGRRLVRGVAYYRETPKDNGYAHPIEGVVAVVDLIAERVIEVIDDGRIIPVPKRKRNYDNASLGTPRPDIKPLDIVQGEGPSFKVDGWHVEWQNWSLRVGFTPREGLVLHQIGYRDQGKLRPIVYRASINEMIVPYADPTTNHYFKAAFDAGEYGLGKFANSLELGCDCLGLIHYFDVAMSDDFGIAQVMKNVVCMHEEDYGILWKHYDFRSDIYQVRRSRRLVVSCFVTVGNYDYGFYWYFYQDGTIQMETKLTGIIQTAAVPTGETYRWGGMVAEGLGGPTHQHLFNARLHMDVDGGGNRVTEHEYRQRPWGADNPHGNAFDTVSRTLARELDACREADGATGRYWKIVNPNHTNAVGVSPGYKMMVHATPLILAQEGASVRTRGGFATKHIWVTRYAADERYASGAYPNQHAGDDGLPRYVRQNRSIDNEDIVLWHTFGHTHGCKPEDFPIMPVETTGFTLRPNNFFEGNPAMDVPGNRNSHSVQHGANDCCHAAE